MECIECLNKNAKRKIKKDEFCTSCMAMDDQVATSAKLLDITHKYYSFSADLIETIN